MSPGAALIIPSFNEARRFELEQICRLIGADDTVVVLVDDGSTDGTPIVLEEARARWPEHVTVLTLAERSGKGEAVRAGLVACATRSTTRSTGSDRTRDSHGSTSPEPAHGRCRSARRAAGPTSI